MSRIGFNVHAQTANLDKARLLTHVERSRPPWMLVMDGAQLGYDILNVSPKTNVIYRAYPDEEIWKQLSPAQWIAQKYKEVGRSRLWLYTVNEQGLSDALCDWHSELIERSESDQIQLVIGNLSAGTPQAADWTRPAVIRLLKLCELHRSRVVVGLHEYACGVITSGFLGGWPNNAGVAPVPDNAGKGRNLIPAANWPDKSEVAKITRFHCGRFKFLLDACKLINVLPPRIVLTEHGFDDMSDIKTWNLQQAQTPPYTSLRGWKSCVNFWSVQYPNWSAQQAMYEQLAYADRVLYQNSPVEGQLLFCWGQSSSQWDQFDLSKAEDFLKRIEAESTPPAPVPTPAPTPVPVPVPVPTPINKVALTAVREHVNATANQARQMALKLATISDDLLKDVDLLDEILKALPPSNP